MEPISPFPQENTSLDWVKSFYEQAGHWWGAEPHEIGVDQARAATIEHFCGSEAKRILELAILEEDFYTVQLEGTFDVVGYWDGFGVGTDADQRRLLRRIATEWLSPDGLALIDFFNPSKAARDAGSQERLDSLPGVPESVEMLRRCHFDPLACLWIDEWVPTAEPDKALAQTLRCYSPADFILLLEGTGLALEGIDLNGTLLSVRPLGITGAGLLPGNPT